MNKQVPNILLFSVFFVLIFFSHASQAKSIQQTVELENNEEITFKIYGKNNTFRILWVAPSYGLQPRHQQSAQSLASNGMEVWQVDLAENLFLPKGAEAMRSIPGNVVANLIEVLSDKGKYKILVITSGYGSIPALRGIHSWQSQKSKHARLQGAILFSPYFYTFVPTLGMAPSFVPVVKASNIPIYIFQGEKNGNRAHFPDMLSALQQNAPVYTQLNKGVTSLFYDEDKAAATINTLANLPIKIQRAISLLKQHEIPVTPVEIKTPATTKTDSGLNVELTPYKGQVQAKPFELKDSNGRAFKLDNFKGKVTLINFWASWCPPCVEEIPSLNRLKEKMKDRPFQLISINFAESSERINEFMKKVRVDFPVLLDSDGSLSTKWKVVAYPSTFVIGADGKIHYGVNAAIHWDTEKVISQLEGIM